MSRRLEGPTDGLTPMGAAALRRSCWTLTPRGRAALETDAEGNDAEAARAAQDHAAETGHDVDAEGGA